MKRFPHLISKLFYEPLAITPRRHSSICQVVEAHMAKVDAGDDDEEEQPEYVTVGDTAIIPVHGVITPHDRDIPMSACGCGLDRAGSMTDMAVSDKTIRRIVFDFDTPGGSVAGVPEMARKIAGIVTKETVAYADSECCSAGLWLASQCQRLYCAPSASIGSIGVWCAYLDISRQLANEGTNIQSISSGKYKLLGAYWKPLSDEEKKMIQADCDKIHGTFKEAVNLHRIVATEFMEGQIFDGERAVEIGLVDGLLDDLGELIDGA